jgi:N-acyl homoserine lactone hydrolase
MRMHVLSGGKVRMKKHVYLPDAPAAEWIDLPVSCFLFRHPQGNVLFDTGCHPSVADNPEARWGALARFVVPAMARDDNLMDELARIGLGPEDVDIVVNSHLHCDHCGCNAFFPRATFYAHADELARARQDGLEAIGYFRADWDHAPPITEVTGEHDLFRDGRLVLLPLPGHMPGLTGLLAHLPASGAYLLASDAVALRDNLEIMPKNIWNPDRHAHSLTEIRRIEKTGARLLYGHDLAQWTELRAEGGVFD